MSRDYYRDPVSGNLIAKTVKVEDTLPVGTEVDYDGTDIPEGWVEVPDGSVIVSPTEPTTNDRKKVWLRHSHNLLEPYNLETTTINGVTFTPVFENGALQYINVNGTATETCSYYINRTSWNLKIPNQQYILSGCPAGGSEQTYNLMISDNQVSQGVDSGSGRTYPANYGTICIIRINNGVTVSNLKFKPMIRLATNTDSSYEPYSEGDRTFILNGGNQYEEYNEKLLVENRLVQISLASGSATNVTSCKITAPRSGLAIVKVTASFSGGGSGIRYVNIYGENGQLQAIANSQVANQNGSTSIMGMEFVNVKAGAEYMPRVEQNSGSAITVYCSIQILYI